MRISNWIKKTKPQLQSPGKKTVFHCSPSVSIHEKRRPNCCEHLVPNDRTNNHGKTIGSNRGFMEAQPTKTQSSCLISSGYSLPNSKCCRIYIYMSVIASSLSVIQCLILFLFAFPYRDTFLTISFASRNGLQSLSQIYSLIFHLIFPKPLPVACQIGYFNRLNQVPRYNHTGQLSQRELEGIPSGNST